MPCYDITEYGAAGDGVTNDGPAIQKAIDACTAAGGGRVLVPGGRTYLSGPFELKSNVDFHLENGATIIASTDRSDYAHLKGRRYYLVGAEGADNVSFTGSGTIDGRGPLFMAEEGPYIFIKGEWRTFLFFLVGCTNLTFRDVTIRDGGAWTLRLSGCSDVLISGVRILCNLKVPNNDALDLDCCKNVRVSDCYIESADDCIVLKTCEPFAEKYGACENITVTGCTLMSTCKRPHHRLRGEGPDAQRRLRLLRRALQPPRAGHPPEPRGGRGKRALLQHDRRDPHLPPQVVGARRADLRHRPAVDEDGHRRPHPPRAFQQRALPQRERRLHPGLDAGPHRGPGAGERARGGGQVVELAGRPARHPPLPRGRGQARGRSARASSSTPRPASSSRTPRASRCATAACAGASSARTTGATPSRRTR